MQSTQIMGLLDDLDAVTVSNRIRLLEVPSTFMHIILLERRGDIRLILQNLQSRDALTDILRDIEEAFQSADAWENLPLSQQEWILSLLQNMQSNPSS